MPWPRLHSKQLARLTNAGSNSECECSTRSEARTLIRETSHPYPRNIVPLSAKHRTLIRKTSHPYPQNIAPLSLKARRGLHIAGDCQRQCIIGSSPACRARLRRAEGTGCSMGIGANLYEALLRQRQAHCATERRSGARAPPRACASQSSTLRAVRASNATQSIASASFADDCAVASTYHVAAEAVMQWQRRRIMGGQTSAVSHICCHRLKCRRKEDEADQCGTVVW